MFHPIDLLVIIPACVAVAILCWLYFRGLHWVLVFGMLAASSAHAAGVDKVAHAGVGGLVSAASVAIVRTIAPDAPKWVAPVVGVAVGALAATAKELDDQEDPKNR